MKTLLKLLTALTLSFVFVACGGGGDTIVTDTTIQNDNTTTDDTGTSVTANGIGIGVCSGSNDGLNEASELNNSATLAGTTDDAKIRLWHLSDGTIKACVLSGTVEVE